MNYKAMIKKQTMVILVAVICLTIATVGASYALFFQVETNSNNQVVTAGSLDVSYTSGSSSIAATELVPMSDEEALSSDTMTGTIYVENKGTLPADYEVALGNDLDSFNNKTDKLESDELLSHEYLRVAVYKDGEIVVEPTTLNTLTKSEHDDELYKLFSGTLDTTGTGHSTMTIVIKVWIAENAPESIIGDYVYLKMDIISEVNEFIADGNTYESASGALPLALQNSTGDYLADYKIYGNSIQNGTPSPTNPVEVQSVGEKTKNLFDESLMLENSQVTKSSEGFINAGYPTNYGPGSLLVKNLKKVLKPNVTYTLSRDMIGYTTAASGSIWIRDTSATIVSVGYGNGVKSVTFSLTQEQIDSITNVYIYGLTATPTTYKYIQLEEGSTATDYEPYGYKIPVEVSGKNLFDFKNKNPYTTTNTTIETLVDGFKYTANNNGGYANYVNYEIDLSGYEGKNITLSGNVELSEGNIGLFRIGYWTTSNTFYALKLATVKDGKNSITAQIPLEKPADAKSGYCIFFNVTSAENMKGATMKVTNIQVEAADSATDYEPYQESEITNIYLDEPLRRTGVYQNIEYVDYIDFASKQVVRNVRKFVYTPDTFSDSYFDVFEPTANNLNRYYVSQKTAANYMVRGSRVPGFTNVLQSNVESRNNWTKEQAHFGQANTGIYLLLSNSYANNTELYNYLSNNGSNEPYFIYSLATSKTEDIDLPNIKTIKGTAVIRTKTKVSPSKMEVSYVKNDQK